MEVVGVLDVAAGVSHGEMTQSTILHLVDGTCLTQELDDGRAHLC